MYLVKCSHWSVLVMGVLWGRCRLTSGDDDVKWGRMMMRNSMRVRSAGLQSGGGGCLDKLKMRRRSKRRSRRSTYTCTKVHSATWQVVRIPRRMSPPVVWGYLNPEFKLNISIILHLIHYLSKCNYEISFQNSTPLPKLLDQKIHSPKKMLEMLTTKKMQTFEVQLKLLHCALQAWCQSRTLPIKWQ